MKSLNPASRFTATGHRGRNLAVVLVLGLSILIPGMARAQTGNSDNLMNYIERTGELLEWAAGLVSETESGPARRVLDKAFELHKRSIDLAGRGRPVESLSSARRARDATWHAVRLSREANALQERIRIRAERFMDQHAHLMERAREAGNRQAVEFLQKAQQQANRAREQYRQGDFKVAWKQLEVAADLMQRAARLLADVGGPERLEREIDRTAELIDQVRQRTQDNTDPQTRNYLAEAEETLDRARQASAQGQPGRALQLAGLARRLALRASGTGTPGSDQERLQSVEQQIERFDERAGRVADRVAESGSNEARKALDRAVEQRRRAAEAVQGDDAELALRQIRAANDLLNQAEDLTRSP